MRIPHSLKSTHWVKWSSPLLLLVLVFTLTASNSTPRVSTLRPITTTTARVMTRISPAASNTPQGVPPVSAPTTTSTTLVIRPLSTVPSTNAPPAKFSLNEIASNVGAVDNARAVSATSGALSGQLSPSFNVADVPLAGPGTWSMTTSSPSPETNRWWITPASFVDAVISSKNWALS